MEVKEVNRLTYENLDEFEDGVDILDLLKVGTTHLEIKTLFDITLPPVAKNFYIYSEQGYMALVGLMRNDDAREIRKKIRREYFTMREIIQSEEEMLKKLYPSVPEDFIKLSAHNIREVANLKLENKKKDSIIIKTKEEVKTKAKMIDDLTTDMDTPLICKTVTDYINILFIRRMSHIQ